MAASAQSRYERARSQHLRLVDKERLGHLRWNFRVLGAREVEYLVQMGAGWSRCECPDHRFRRAICKHIMFISARVLQMPPGMYYSGMTEAFEARLLRLFPSSLPNLPPPLAPKEEKELLKAQQTESGDDCPICFESLAEGDDPPLESCGTCHNRAHASCIIEWTQRRPTCPLCRADWPSAPSTRRTPSAAALEQDVTETLARLNLRTH